eukprot:scaffold13097_cov59-Phaeocystis_antarctica.AAC.2
MANEIVLCSTSPMPIVCHTHSPPTPSGPPIRRSITRCVCSAWLAAAPSSPLSFDSVAPPASSSSATVMAPATLWQRPKATANSTANSSSISSGDSSSSNVSGSSNSNATAAACHSAALASRLCLSCFSSCPMTESGSWTESATYPEPTPAVVPCSRLGARRHALSAQHRVAAHHFTEHKADATSTACASIRLLFCGSLHVDQLPLKAQLVLLVHHRRLLCLGVAQLSHRLLEGARRLLACPLRPRIVWKRQRSGLHVQLLERLDQREREQRALDERPQEGLAAAPPRVDAHAERGKRRLRLACRRGDCLGVDRAAQPIDTRGRVRHAAGRVVAGGGRGASIRRRHREAQHLRGIVRDAVDVAVGRQHAAHPLAVARQVASHERRQLRARVEAQHLRGIEREAVDVAVGRQHAVVPLGVARQLGAHERRLLRARVEAQHLLGIARDAVDVAVGCQHADGPLGVTRQLGAHERRLLRARVEAQHLRGVARDAVDVAVGRQHAAVPLAAVARQLGAHERRLLRARVEAQHLRGVARDAVDVAVGRQHAAAPLPVAARQLAAQERRLLRARVEAQHLRGVARDAVDVAVGRQHAAGPRDPARQLGAHERHLLCARVEAQHLRGIVRDAVDVAVGRQYAAIPLASTRQLVAHEPRLIGIHRVGHVPSGPAVQRRRRWPVCDGVARGRVESAACEAQLSPHAPWANTRVM